MGLNSTQMPAGRASFNFDRAALPKWLDDLVACGQVTACYCILQHFVQILNPNPHLPIGTQTPGDQPLTPYFKQALKDWELLKEDPYALLPSAASRNGEAEKPTARSAGV